MMQAGACVGVAVYDGNCGDVEADHLIRQADQAMYVIKKSGKNGFAYADDGGRPADIES
jgi:GGDEF domain-containing protein